MSIIRVRKDAKYFAASNEPFNDKRLLWETRGMMGYLLSKPDRWEVRLDDLISNGPAGRDKIRRMLADARRHGYMNRIRVTMPGGTFSWITEVYESPSLNPRKKTSGGFSVSGEPVAGFPQVEKPVTGKPVDVLNTDEVSTETGSGRALFKTFEQEIGPITPMIADALKDAEQTYPAEWLEAAIGLAVKHNKRNWKYSEAILRRWKIQGHMDEGRKPAEKKAKSQGGKSALKKFAEEQGV